MQHDRSSTNLLGIEGSVLHRYATLCKAEQMILQQRAKEHFLREGDDNSRYFYDISKQKCNQNFIHKVVDGAGVEYMQQKSITNAFINFYHSLVGTTLDVSPLDIEWINVGPVLTSLHQSMLMAPFTPAEIKDALFSMHDDKGLGLDGYSVGFYKDAWPIIGNDITQAVL